MDISVASDDGEQDDELDRERIAAALADEMSDLSSDDDFEPSAFHRNLRQKPPAPTFDNFRRNEPNETASFSSFEKGSPVHYQSKIPKPSYSPSQCSPRREESAEMTEVKALYTAARRRIQELEQKAKENNETYDENVRLLRHEKQLVDHRNQEVEEHLASLRGEHNKSQDRAYALSNQVDSLEQELANFRRQNDEFQSQIVTQEATIQSLENELRVAHSDDALQKAKFTHQRRIDEMRRQHDETISGLKSEMGQKTRQIEAEKQLAERIKLEKREMEKEMNKELIDKSETINRLHALLRDAQRHPVPVDSVAQKLDFEPSEYTFDASTPRNIIDGNELQETRHRYQKLRSELDEERKNRIIAAEELQRALENSQIVEAEKEKLKSELREARDELSQIGEDFELFRNSASQDKETAIEQNRTLLEEHFRRSLQMQVEQVKAEGDAASCAIRTELESKIQSQLAELKEYETSLDEIKKDYCDLASEKKRIELQKGATEQNKAQNEELDRTKAELAHAQKHIQNLEVTHSNLTCDWESSLNSIENLKNEIAELKTLKKDSARDPDKKSLEQIKRKFAAEREVWAKEKRRLESKMRHLSKQIDQSPSSSVCSETPLTPRDTNGICPEEFKRLQSQLAQAKVKYNETLRRIKDEVANTIEQMKERNNERVRAEVLMEQKRTSEKLREYYKNLLSKLLSSDSFGGDEKIGCRTERRTPGGERDISNADQINQWNGGTRS